MPAPSGGELWVAGEARVKIIVRLKCRPEGETGGLPVQNLNAITTTIDEQKQAAIIGLT